MDRTQTLKWLHRIGYICTVLVALELIVLAGLATAGWLGHRRMDAMTMAESRTHDGPVSADKHRLGAFETLKPLPSLASLEGNGFRFAAMPGLGWYWYALSLGGKGDEVQGTLIVTQRASKDNQDFAPPTIKRFTMPRAAYARFMAGVDTLTHTYDGDKGMCIDGIGVAFERVRGTQVISGEGNGGCSDYYRAIQTAVLPVVQQAAGADWRISSDWGSELKAHAP